MAKLTTINELADLINQEKIINNLDFVAWEQLSQRRDLIDDLIIEYFPNFSLFNYLPEVNGVQAKEVTPVIDELFLNKSNNQVIAIVDAIKLAHPQITDAYFTEVFSYLNIVL